MFVIFCPTSPFSHFPKPIEGMVCPLNIIYCCIDCLQACLACCRSLQAARQTSAYSRSLPDVEQLSVSDPATAHDDTPPDSEHKGEHEEEEQEDLPRVPASEPRPLIDGVPWARATMPARTYADLEAETRAWLPLWGHNMAVAHDLGTWRRLASARVHVPVHMPQSDHGDDGEVMLRTQERVSDDHSVEDLLEEASVD